MKLLEPIKINGVTLKNRMVVSAMVTNYCREDGMPTEKFTAYHEKKARGGWGLIITEDFAIAPGTGAFRRLPGLWDDQQIPAYQEFSRRIHEAGGKVVAQIYHAGRETCAEITGQRSVAPSAIKHPMHHEIPKELELAEIQQIVAQFGDCALRAKQAGFDGVEIHGAHGYLINQFYSPLCNKRADEYGGTAENRLRFPLEVVKEIRRKCGSDFLLLYRMSVQEYIDGGISVQDSVLLAKQLEKAGVDCIHCSQGVSTVAQYVIPPSCVRPAAYVENAAAIKREVSIPVIAVGRMNDPLVAEAVLMSGKADLCTMGRASLADPELPRKVYEGKQNEIIHCIGCLQGCIGENSKGNCVRCLVNPMTGMEDTYQLVPAEVPKRIVVIGGGVAGCEAAIMAAKKGNQVFILEKTSKLGGQWLAAAIPPGKSEFSSLVVWQKQQLRALGVEVVLQTPATQELIRSYHPDLIINATGSLASVPPVPGLREYGVTAEDVLRGNVLPGKNVVVIGGGLVGAETADHLAMHGSSVTLLEMQSSIMNDAEAIPKTCIFERFRKNGVKVITSAALTQVTAMEVLYQYAGKEHTLTDVDTVVVAAGRKVNPAIQQMMEGWGYPVIAVGDAKKVKNGYLNIREGFEAGLYC